MNRHATDVQEPVQESGSSPPLPADHVLSSGAVLFPGAFDQHGCPLIVFPVDGQTRLSSELSKADVVDFINYFHGLHIKKQEKQSLVSVVADLRQASPAATRFITETLLLLEASCPALSDTSTRRLLDASNWPSVLSYRRMCSGRITSCHQGWLSVTATKTSPGVTKQK